MTTKTLNHSQCLPFCGHLILVREREADLNRQARLLQAKLDAIHAQQDELDRQARVLKAAGAVE